MGRKSREKLARRLERAERASRIENLKNEIKDLKDGDVIMESKPEMEDSPLMENFMKSVLAFEKTEITTDFDQLLEAGIMLPEPESLNDGELGEKLGEVVDGLAARNTFLKHTDHLSDRELYTLLWTEVLRRETQAFEPGSQWVERIDIGEFPDEQTFLKYYAMEEDYDMFDLPPDEIPAHVDPPYDRDRRLPQPPPPH